jgi:hypothetical protein
MPALIAIQAEQAAGLTILARAVAGTGLSPEEIAAAIRLLAGVSFVLTANEQVALKVYNASMAARPPVQAGPAVAA